MREDHELHRKASQGGLWTMFGFGAGQVLRLVSNLILTRLIPREAFGVMLLVQVVLQGLGRFSDIGIGPAVIQNKRDDRAFLDTAWTIQTIRGAILALCAALLAWPAARFFDEPSLLALVPFAGTSALFAGLQSSKMHSANRELLVGRLMAVNLVGQVAGLGVALVWGFARPGVWALAGAGVASAVVTSAASHLILPGKINRWTWDSSSARAVLTFGKWVFVSTLLSFFATQSDRIVFGRLFEAEELGVYAIATLIVDAPQRLLRMMSLRVDFPLYSHTLRQGRALGPAFRRGRRRVLAFGGACCALMLAAGPLLIDVLYPDTYAGAGWMISVLAVGTWFNTLEVTVEAPLLARGEPRKIAVANLVKVLGMLAMMLIGYRLGGFAGSLVGLASSEAIRYVYIRVSSRDAALGAVGQDLLFTLGFLLTAGMGAVAAAGGRSLAIHEAWIVLGVTLLVFGAWLPWLLPELRRSMPTRSSKTTS